MSLGFTDWIDNGVWPLQDHEPGVPIEIRQTMVGARVARIEDPSRSSVATLALYATEDDLGTMGDVHPWTFWQTKTRRDRAMGSWAMGFASLSIAGASGGVGRGGTGSRPTPTEYVPIKKDDYEADQRYKKVKHEWPRCLAVAPRGVAALISAGTEESTQETVALWGDPRLFAVHTSKPAEAGTLVVDLQPDAEPCMDGSTEPGVGGRSARLQSVFRVVPIGSGRRTGPTSGSTRGVRLGNSPLNGVALNFGLSSIDKALGLGMIFGEIDAGFGRTVATQPTYGGGPTRGSSRKVCDFGRFLARQENAHGVAFLASKRADGPIHLGHGNDKHEIGRDRDGHAMNSAHISTRALFYRNRDEDAPLLFEGPFPDNVRSFPLRSHVHLSYDDDVQHPWVGGAREGYWRWWTTVPYVTPRTPTTPPPTYGPVTPGRPGRPGGPSTPRSRPGTPLTPRGGGGGGGPTIPGTPGTPAGGQRQVAGGNAGNDPPDPPVVRRTQQQFVDKPIVIPRTVGDTSPSDLGHYVVHHPFQESFSGISFRPQMWEDGHPNYLRDPTRDGDDYVAEERTRPHVLSAYAWGAQDAGEWDYACPPEASRARGGTVSGGVLFGVPHLEMEDYLGINSRESVTTIKTLGYVAVAPNVAFALGTPNTDGGLDAASVVIAQNSASANRTFTIYQLNSSRTATTLLSGDVDQSTGEVIVGIGRGGNQAIRIPDGTTAQRPATPAAGMIRINTSGANDVVEFYDSQGTTWTSLGSGGGSSTFVGLSDTPANYTSSAGYLVRVNATPDGLEFVDGSTIYQPLDAELTAIAGLTSAADRLPYFTGSGTASLATFTAFARTILDDADAATVRTTIGAAPTSHTHAASDITSGTFDDARVAETNVTQWQAALSITESQISDLGAYLEAGDSPTITGDWTFDPNSGVNWDTEFLNSGGGSHSVRVDGAFVLGSATFDGTIQRTGLTADRSWTFPNASGTVALTSDIPSLSGYTQAAGTETISGTWTFQNNVTLDTADLVFDEGSWNGTLTPATLTADRTWTLPNTSGTLAVSTAVVLLDGSTTMSGNLSANVVSGWTISNSTGDITIDAGTDLNLEGSVVTITSTTGSDIRLAAAGNIDAQSNRITSLAAATADSDAPRWDQVKSRCGVVIGVGSSFPGSPSTGDRFTRTDLDYDEFVYDGSEWIGTTLVMVDGGINSNGITTAQYLTGGPANQSTQFRSPALPWNAKLVKITTFIQGTVTNTNVIVRRNGSNVVTVNRTSADTYPTGQVSTVDDNTFGQGDIVQLYVDPTPGSDSINAPRVTAWFRRRAT